MPSPLTEQIAFLGTGKMATALARGMIHSEIVPPNHVTGYDLSPDARDVFTKTTGASTVDALDPLLNTDLLILAVKPQHMESALADLTERLNAGILLVTIAAGLPISFYTKTLGNDIRLVRVMPNTPCLVGAGASAYALGGKADSDDGQLVRRILETVGVALPLPESLLDAVTGLSGSGPAYGYQIIEALSDAGVREGLPRATATRLAAQTLLGAAKMVLETGEHPGALKDAVTSPGGTTIAGVYQLEKNAMRSALMDAVAAATARSRELRGE